MEHEKPIEYENSLTRHLILYAKGHYDHGKDQMSDIKLLMSNRSGVGIEHFTDITVYSFVSECFVEACPKKDMVDILQCFYRKPYFIGTGQATLSEMVSHMLGLMGCLQINETKKRKLVPIIALGEPNPEYLPLPRKEKGTASA